MLRHIAMFRFKDSTDAADVAVLGRLLMEQLVAED